MTPLSRNALEVIAERTHDDSLARVEATFAHLNGVDAWHELPSWDAISASDQEDWIQRVRHIAEAMESSGYIITKVSSDDA